MSKDPFEELLDIVEHHEKLLISLRAEVEKLQGFDLGNAMMMQAFMTVLHSRGFVNFDDLSVAIQSTIASAEKSDKGGIHKHAVEHLKRLSRMTLLGAAVSTPPRNPSKAN